MTRTAHQTISVIVHRSQVLDQHHAYVRVGGVEAGYRDLRTGVVHCAEPGYLGTVAEATAPLLAGPARGASTAELYRAPLRATA